MRSSNASSVAHPLLVGRNALRQCWRGPGTVAESAAADGLTAAAELSARLLEQLTHLRASAEHELMRGRSARLDDEIAAMRKRLASAEAERSQLCS